MSAELFDSQVDDTEVTDAPAPSAEDKFEQAFEAAVELNDESPVVQQVDNQPSAPELIAGIPVDEFKAVFEKAKQFDELQAQHKQLSDKVFGTVGQLKQELNGLKQNRSGFDVTADKFKALTEYFGDDQLAQALAQDLGGLSIGGTAAEPIDFDSKLAEATTKLSQAFEIKLLTVQHPDWKQVTGVNDAGEFTSESFINWLGTLSEEGRDRVLNSWDGVEMASAISKHKQWLSDRERKSQEKNNRLESNIAPRGIPGIPNRSTIQDYESAFNAGLNGA